MNAKRASVIIFRIVYSSSYSIFFIALLLLLAVTPGDHIYQTVSNHKLGNVFVVGGTYLVTGLIALFIYASRLYTNRTTLAAIPKPYLPIEEGEVSKNVRKIIVRNRQRSALIALQSRPRPSTYGSPGAQPDPRAKELAHEAHRREAKHKGLPKDAFMEWDPSEPPWGEIVHPGWSGPASHDVPDLQFDTVVAELPNLIEAQAVSLAPQDENFKFVAGTGSYLQAPPNPVTVSQLQRRRCQGLRDYLSQLHALGVLSSQEIIDSFLIQYEYARFSTHALPEDEFRELMALFSTLLSGLHRPGQGATLESPTSPPMLSSDESSDSGSLRRRNWGRKAAKADALSLSSVGSSGSVVHHHADEGG